MCGFANLVPRLVWFPQSHAFQPLSYLHIPSLDLRPQIVRGDVAFVLLTHFADIDNSYLSLLFWIGEFQMVFKNSSSLRTPIVVIHLRSLDCRAQLNRDVVGQVDRKWLTSIVHLGSPMLLVRYLRSFISFRDSQDEPSPQPFISSLYHLLQPPYVYPRISSQLGMKACAEDIGLSNSDDITSFRIHNHFCVLELSSSTRQSSHNFNICKLDLLGHTFGDNS